MVIALLNPKGGVGKSTIAAHVATAAHRSDVDTHIIDTDPQATIQDWHSLADPGHTPGVSACVSPKQLQTHLSSIDADLVVIDGAARVQRMVGAVLNVAQIVLIPVQPSTLDVWGTIDLIDACAKDDTLHAAFVLNRYTVGANITSDAREALADYGLPVLQGCAQRVAYPESMQTGETVLTYHDHKARAEAEALADDVGDLISNSTVP